MGSDVTTCLKCGKPGPGESMLIVCLQCAAARIAALECAEVMDVVETALKTKGDSGWALDNRSGFVDDGVAKFPSGLLRGLNPRATPMTSQVFDGDFAETTKNQNQSRAES